MSASPATVATRSPAQLRILAAALELFAAHGVSGTSLQMIADTIGVTKAAVYHQFNTKAEIILAVTEVELASLESALEAAERESSPDTARWTLLNATIDIAVRRRTYVRVMQNDPVVVQLLAEHEPFRDIINRLYGTLMGSGTGEEARVSAALMSAAIAGGVVHPWLADLDEDDLKMHLLEVARRLFDIRTA